MSELRTELVTNNRWKIDLSFLHCESKHHAHEEYLEVFLSCFVQKTTKMTFCWTDSWEDSENVGFELLPGDKVCFSFLYHLFFICRFCHFCLSSGLGWHVDAVVRKHYVKIHWISTRSWKFLDREDVTSFSESSFVVSSSLLLCLHWNRGIIVFAFGVFVFAIIVLHLFSQTRTPPANPIDIIVVNPPRQRIL